MQADRVARTFGDNDCNGSVSLGDSIGIARFLIGIVPNVPDCPPLGSTVSVQT